MSVLPEPRVYRVLDLYGQHPVLEVAVRVLFSILVWLRDFAAHQEPEPGKPICAELPVEADKGADLTYIHSSTAPCPVVAWFLRSLRHCLPTGGLTRRKPSFSIVRLDSPPTCRDRRL